MLQLLHKLLDTGLHAVAQPPGQEASSMASVFIGARASGSQISVSYFTSMQGNWGPRGLAVGMARGLVGIGGIQREKETMQCLNDHLASYLERVRSLEADNQRLDSKIWEYLEKKGPQVRDWVHYFKTIEDLRAHIFANSGGQCQHHCAD